MPQLFNTIKEKLQNKITSIFKTDINFDTTRPNINISEIIDNIKEKIKKFFNIADSQISDNNKNWLKEIIDKLKEKITNFFTGGGTPTSGKDGTKISKSNSSKESKDTKSKTTQVVDVQTNASEVTKKLQETFAAAKGLPTTTPANVSTNAPVANAQLQVTQQKALQLSQTKPKIQINAQDNTGGVISTIRTKLANLAAKAKSALKIGGNAKGANLASAAKGKNVTGSAAKGAKRGKLGPSGKGGLTLTGELGPELVWEPDKSESYITGANGPEMRNLSKNAVVWPADQTKKIMSSAAKGKNFGSMADADFSSLLGNSGSGGNTSQSNGNKHNDNTSKDQKDYQRLVEK